MQWCYGRLCNKKPKDDLLSIVQCKLQERGRQVARAGGVLWATPAHGQTLWSRRLIVAASAQVFIPNRSLLMRRLICECTTQCGKQDYTVFVVRKKSGFHGGCAARVSGYVDWTVKEKDRTTQNVYTATEWVYNIIISTKDNAQAFTDLNMNKNTTDNKLVMLSPRKTSENLMISPMNWTEMYTCTGP